MNTLRKNLAAKILAVVASLAGLVGLWGVVHQNPPPPTPVDAATDPQPTPAARPGKPSQTNNPAIPKKKHTRTHVS